MKVCWLSATFSQMIPESPIKQLSNAHLVTDTKAQRGEATCLWSHSRPAAPPGSKPSLQAGGPSRHLGVSRASGAPQAPEGTSTTDTFSLSWWFSHSVVSDSCDPVNCSLPGSSVHRISQARILEWATISFSRGSSRPRHRTQVSCTAGRFFTN